MYEATGNAVPGSVCPPLTLNAFEMFAGEVTPTWPCRSWPGSSQAGGMLYVVSGNAARGGLPGNVLVAFSAEP